MSDMEECRIDRIAAEARAEWRDDTTEWDFPRDLSAAADYKWVDAKQTESLEASNNAFHARLLDAAVEHIIALRSALSAAEEKIRTLEEDLNHHNNCPYCAAKDMGCGSCSDCPRRFA